MNDGFTIGSREDLPVGNQLWNGDISEVLVYDRALDAETRRDVEVDLATKYAIDSVHPVDAVPNATVELADAKRLAAEIIRTAYSRSPTERELAVIDQQLKPGDRLKEQLEDLMWAVLNSKEFLFQH